MRYSKKILLYFTICLLTFFLSNLLSEPSVATAAGHRGIWLSYVDFEDAGLYDRTQEDFIAACEMIFSTLETYGFNNIYFHVRPYDDAIYPNSSFSWCEYISPQPLEYDALRILIDTAHRHNVSFHAWINPYRITTDTIYNPAKDSTTGHIVEGVKEIIENYNVDGIHFDDYFYPSPQKGRQFYSVSAKDRMTNVNYMIKTVYETIKNYNEDIKFGISPSGNTEYAKSIGCDIETWLTEDGYIDYIIPQLYWSDNYRIGGKKVPYYTQTLKEWTSLNTNNVPMYIGLALYKAGTKRSEDPGWINSNNNLADQTKLLRRYKCKGQVLFSYKYLFTPEGRKETAGYIKYISNFKSNVNTIRLKKGKKYNLAKHISVSKAFKTTFKYSSSSKKTAVITNSGIITARKKGLTRISVKGLARSKVTCIVRVI